MSADSAFRSELARSQPPTRGQANDLAGHDHGELIRRNLKLIYGLCRKFFRDPDDCQDAVQECSLLLWQKIPKYNPDRGAFSTFAHEVVKCHLIAMHHHNQRKRQLRMEQDGYTEDWSEMAVDDDHNPSKMVETEEGDLVIYRAVKEAVQSLPNDLQEVVKKRFGMECEPEILKQIGDGMGCSHQWVRQLEKRALNRIARQLEPVMA